MGRWSEVTIDPSTFHDRLSISEEETHDLRPKTPDHRPLTTIKNHLKHEQPSKHPATFFNFLQKNYCAFVSSFLL